MAWDPETYNKFKHERFAPFYDLLQLIKIRPGIDVIDLGCGTGELTTKLADHLPGARIMGIDSSKEMLKETGVPAHEDVTFACRTIEEEIISGKKWDLIFSNAAIQWIGDHPTLFPRIISNISKGGQLAVQIPSNHNHPTHKLLVDIASTEPYRTALSGWIRLSPVLAIEAYAEIFFNNGGDEITVYEKAYPHVLHDATALYEWTSGTAMIPYIERLPRSLGQNFKDEYKKQLKDQYPAISVFYPFKRIIMSATF